MTKRISATEMSKALNVSRNTLNTYIYQAAPDEWEFEKNILQLILKGFFNLQKRI